METPHHTLSLNVHTAADAEANQLRDDEGPEKSPDRSDARSASHSLHSTRVQATRPEDDEETQIEEAELANVRSQAPQSPPDTSPTPQ